MCCCFQSIWMGLSTFLEWRHFSALTQTDVKSPAPAAVAFAAVLTRLKIVCALQKIRPCYENIALACVCGCTHTHVGQRQAVIHAAGRGPLSLSASPCTNYSLIYEFEHSWPSGGSGGGRHKFVCLVEQCNKWHWGTAWASSLSSRAPVCLSLLAALTRRW